MQTSKFLLAMGALATVILPLQVQAGPDTPEQAKMREVLRRMTEPPKAADTVAPPATPAPAKPVVVTPPPPAPKPVAAPVAPVTPVAPPPVAKPIPTAVVAVPAAAVVVAQPTSSAFESVPPPDDAASIARAREVMRQKMLELQATPAPAPTAPVAATPAAPASAATPTPVAPIAVTPSRPTTVTAPVLATTYAPIQAPDSPLSSSKQAKLAELLVRYKADSITAQEYHTQRAVILAGP